MIKPENYYEIFNIRSFEVLQDTARIYIVIFLTIRVGPTPPGTPLKLEVLAASVWILVSFAIQLYFRHAEDRSFALSSAGMEYFVINSYGQISIRRMRKQTDEDDCI